MKTAYTAAHIAVAALFAGLSAGANADAITDWNIKSGEIVVESKLGTPPAIRVMAIVQTAALEAWFDDAAAIGTGGSNIEMDLAPAGWAFDPANNATNAGFLRDEGAMLTEFFLV